MLELLAPAGSMEALRAAVQNGANAVYLGCDAFNARQGAKNFTLQTLPEAVKYCHVRGVAVHLTLNTLVSDREIPDVTALIRHAASCGVDAFIVQDPGVITLCRTVAPDIPLHGSTQMSVHSLPGVLLCAAWGLSRVVLSRELSREQISYICANSPVEIEVFGHGALCMCYSGQCYLSSVIGGRSGNRGRCAQPCRQSYGFGHWQERYPLSLKDNCLVHEVTELAQMGVASLKLEGRMKRPEYVAAVTDVYRRAIDTGIVTPDMERRLYNAFNRQGFTDGYYTGKTGPQMFGIREGKGEDGGWMREARRSYESVENPLVPVRFEMTMRDDGTTLTAIDPQGRVCTLTGAAPENARVLELTHDAVEERLRKTGGTPYYCTQVQTHLLPGKTLSAAAINAMRRDVLNLLTAQRARHDTPHLERPPKFPVFRGVRGRPELTVQVTSREQITPKLLSQHIAVLYVPLYLLVSDPAFCQTLAAGRTVCAVLPRIVTDTEMPKLRQDLRAVRALGVREVLAGNLGLLLPARECGMRVRGDFGLNLYNSGAVCAAKELELRSACLSFEMTLPQIRDVSKALPCEILSYGRLPLMVTENCIIRQNTGTCTCRQGSVKLTDKTGAEFPVIHDGNSCRSILLNGKKLSLLDRQEDLAQLGLWAHRVFFTTENPREVDRVLDACEEPVPFEPGACTRGLYLRGLD